MSFSILHIAVSGLQAAQAGLSTAGHNIANVNTAGFSRQQVTQSNAPGQFSGSGYFGRGVTVDGVVRRYDDLLAAQARESAGAAAHQQSVHAQAAAIDQLLGDEQIGLATVANDFFAGLDTLAAQPGDAAARQSALASASALASRVRLLDDALSARSAGIDRAIEVQVGSINAITHQVADVNRRIVVGQASGQSPNDLLDLRDRLVDQLNGLVGVTTVAQGDGSVNAFLANGQALVVGEKSFDLTASADRFDASRRVVGLQAGANFLEFDASQVTGGELGGLLAARRDVVDPAINALGRVAMSLASAVNAQHRLGMDRAGQMGGDLFGVAAPWVASASGNAGDARLAAALAATAAMTSSDYDITRTSAGWTVTRLSDGFIQTFPTLPAAIDGITLSVASGNAATGDKFLLRPGRDGAAGFDLLVSDPQRLAAGAPMRTSAATSNAGSGAISPGSVTAVSANLQQPVAITFTSATTFNVTGTGTGNPTGLAYTPGMSLAYNGWSATLTGTPAAGDSFSVGPNTAGVGDNRNAAALAGLATTRVVGGTQTVAEGYGALVAFVGAATHEAAVAAEAQGALAAEAHRAVQSVSGVNLDEEAANLLRYQQAYQAAAKVVAAANAMFDTLIEVTR